MLKLYNPFIILAIFSSIFIALSISQMQTIPLHDYDEANRAEGARNMGLHNYYTSPLTGAPTGSKSLETRIPYAQDATKGIWPRSERPPLVFILMTVSSSLFGDTELSYRLPSFLFGILTIVILIVFTTRFSVIARSETTWQSHSTKFFNSTIQQFNNITIKQFFNSTIRQFSIIKSHNIYPIIIALLVLLTSHDWWLSSQMAHLDTGLSFGLFLSLISLMLYAHKKRQLWLITAGVSIGIAILSKAQPAILILLPLFTLWVYKKISLKNITFVLIIAGLTISPWVIELINQHGLSSMLKQHTVTMVNNRALKPHDTQSAPIFWYFRWWLDMFRPAIFLFLAFLSLQLIKRKFTWQTTTLILYILGTLLLFSLAKNKVWWYILPAIPAIALYLFYATKDYLDQSKNHLFPISLIIFMGSAPFVLMKTNTHMLAYGLFITLISILLLKSNKLSSISQPKQQLFFLISIIFSLSVFLYRFPAPNPTHLQTKPVASKFQDLPYPKCLAVDPDMPYEAPLFYSKAGQVYYYDPQENLDPNCTNYLISNHFHDFIVIYSQPPITLYQLDSN